MPFPQIKQCIVPTKPPWIITISSSLNFWLQNL